ncbi:hypothetical protein Q2317_26215, partial [Escherichia coli]|nr:hypothetical protein [Escherichia coli]
GLGDVYKRQVVSRLVLQTLLVFDERRNVTHHAYVVRYRSNFVSNRSDQDVVPEALPILPRTEQGRIRLRIVIQGTPDGVPFFWLSIQAEKVVTVSIENVR